MIVSGLTMITSLPIVVDDDSDDDDATYRRVVGRIRP